MRKDSVQIVVYSNFVCNRLCNRENMKPANNYRRTTPAKLEAKLSLNKMRAEETKFSMCCQTKTTSVGF